MTIMTAEYIWIDGSEPVPALRSKARVLPLKKYWM
jgi:glutamine synthetase